MSNPPQPFMTYAMVRDWFIQNGLPESQLKKMIRSGKIELYHPGGGKWNYYNGEQILRAVNGSKENASDRGQK